MLHYLPVLHVHELFILQDVDEGVYFLRNFGVTVDQFTPQNFSVEKQ